MYLHVYFTRYCLHHVFQDTEIIEEDVLSLEAFLKGVDQSLRSYGSHSQYGKIMFVARGLSLFFFVIEQVYTTMGPQTILQTDI